MHNERMKHFNWSEEKNAMLKASRNLSFDEIVLLIQSEQLLGVEEHPNRPNQKLYILAIENYAVVVPFVESDDEIFLKTAFPSRKFTKQYGLGESDG